MVLESLGAKELFGGFKVGESVYKYFKKDKIEDYKIFEKIYQEVIHSLDKEYPTIEIIRLFDNNEIKDMYLKMIFSNNTFDISLFNQHIHLDTLPSNIIYELYNKLKDNIKATPLTKYLKESEQIMFLESIDRTLIDLQKIIVRKINIQKFREHYKDNAIREYSRIQFFGIKLPTAGNNPMENKLERLYVVPSFNDYHEKKSIDLDEMIENHRLVILGKPGSGKSTFVKYLILEELKNTTNLTIPLRIILKDYDTYLQSNNSKNLEDFIINELSRKFNTSEINRDNVSEIFNNEPFSFYFDGLDEVFSEQRRANIRDDIENFGNNYKNNKIIITSRIVGYSDSPFDSDYLIYEINDFDEERIDQYVENWFNIDIEKNLIEEYHDRFELERTSIGIDLLGNPLMLSIILILFTRGFSIPSSKLAIYQSCTETLVDKWEDQKEMNIDIPKKSQAIAHLAFWQYEDVHDDIAVQTEMTKFYDSFSDDYTHEESESNAFNFMSYLHKRSIYFNDMFVHKTFLEYYTAKYIFTKYEKKGNLQKRNELISSYMNDSYWFVVLELLIAMIDKDQADNEIIEELITTHTKNKTPEKYSFFIKNLKNIKNISKRYREKLLRTSFYICLDETKENYQDEISLSLCSSSIISLHQSFDSLNQNDMQYVISLIDEGQENYSFEVTAFFTELNNYSKLIDISYMLKQFIALKMYSAYLLFNPYKAGSYTNWNENFHIQLLNTDFSFVYNDKPEENTIINTIHRYLDYTFEDDMEQFGMIIEAIENSTISFYELPIPDMSIIRFYRLSQIVQYVESNDAKAYFLYLMYHEKFDERYSILSLFLDVPDEYRSIIVKYYEKNIVLTSSKVFYDELESIS